MISETIAADPREPLELLDQQRPIDPQEPPQ